MKIYVVVVKFNNGNKDILLETMNWNHAMIFAKENVIYYGYNERLIIETTDKNGKIIDKYVMRYDYSQNKKILKNKSVYKENKR